ncbi:MAG: winged helix-turn-helix domain-containing protein [Candidatus Bathyarchaeia archaeon]
MVKLSKTDEKVIAALKDSGELTLKEISEKTGESPKKVFKSLRKLFENEIVDTEARKYKLAAKEPSKSDEEETQLPEE